MTKRNRLTHTVGHQEYGVNSVDRAFQILDYLKVQNRAINVSDLARNLNIPRSTVFRIIRTLEKRRYVVEVDDVGRYIIGSGIISLATPNDYLSRLRQIASPYLFELAKITGQTVQLGVLFEYEVMYIDQIQAGGSISVVVPSEKPFPINLSAGGKVLAAYLHEDRIEELLQYTEFHANTPRTITDKDAFREELQRVRKEGVGHDDEEFAKGIRCMAAPVFDQNNDNILSLGVTGHISEITDENMDGMVANVVAVANRLSRALGHESSR